ncbi:wall-associated receptor kinase-like 14 [Gossypium australe]|uniref:Wall-associated receptor kinase-like 14 n=1 Tax=Gossypium australe TaxID=47621 RepID=A0A5B6VZG5_9ROSI|nr:wall-associated receptor kinase-like 14 [Gossypium australe]
MAEEEVTAVPVTMTEQTPESKKVETLEAQGSIEGTIKSAVRGGTESTCNNENNTESCGIAPDIGRAKALEFADELTEKGSKAFRENDFTQAAHFFRRSLEIRALHRGELAVACLNVYYLYGRALLCKAQEETGPLVSVPDKDGEILQDSNKEGPTKSAVTRESSVASVSSNSEQDGSEKDEDSDDSDTDDVIEAEANEDVDELEMDLDLAWKMLDIARAIAEKQQLGDTMEKVDILSALAEVDLEREDIESSLGNYQKALSILQQLVEPDHRQIAELNFRICTCLEIGSNPKEAILYGQKAISVCKSRVERLTNEIMISTALASSSAASELGNGEQLSKGSQAVLSVKDKEAEIDNLVGLAEDLEKKANLEQLISNPKSIIAEIQGIASGKARGGENNASPAAVNSSHMSPANSNVDHFDSPTVSTAHTNGAAVVTHLGIVGRGVKHVLMSAGATESSSIKKPAIDP